MISKRLWKMALLMSRKNPFSCQDDDLTPMKTGEVFRSKMGKFTFICTYCRRVFYECTEMINHINSHFDQPSSFDHVNIEMARSQVALPATDPLKLENVDITNNGTFHDLTNFNSQPKPNILDVKTEKMDVDDTEPKRRKTTVIRVIKVPASQVRSGEKNKNVSKADSNNWAMGTTNLDIVKKEDSATSNEECKKEDKSEEVKPPKTTVIKLIKVPISKIKELKSYSPKTKSIKTEMKTSPETSSLLPESKSTLSDESQAEPVIVDKYSLNSSNPVTRPAYVRHVVRSKCYQCEMEPRIYNESDARRHICLFCSEWFPNHCEFESHATKVHKKDPNFVRCSDFHCYVCGKKFAFRNYLTSHLKVHVENKDHLCATCGSTFRTLSRLTEHMKAHKNLTYECDKCDKKFSRFDRFRKHLWCHNTNLSYVCHICSKAFKMKMYLKRHMAIHNEVKLNCRYCDASFNFATVRRAHERNRHNVV
ncbi:Zinc finger protein [Pseudolycoriella hygida]|uniref:Zinc finger protein n=1 Tax=Pseudolycoriella hygida TaxID=35572 RepID=A0A9Q0NBJ7_9DIPT|nr:Zinc finger protein [Pseudolycoriella hygida]